MVKLRHYFYATSLFLSGGSLVLMTLLILAQIIARFLGEVIPSSEDFAGWLLSATVFFGLAYTFNIGGHIRVTMVLSRLNMAKRRWLESFNILVGVFISCFLAYYTSYTVYESYIFEDVSDTYLVVPLWIVQGPMALGSIFLFVAMMDSAFSLFKGKIPNYIAHEDEVINEGME